MFRAHSTQRLNELLYWLFLAWLAWLPLPIGSNRPIWVGVALAWLALIAAAWLLSWLSGRLQAPAAFQQAWPAWLPLVLLLGWIIAQAWLPGSWAAPWVREAYQAAGSDPHPLTVDRYAGIDAFWHVLLALGAFCMTVLLVQKRSQLRRLLWTLVWVGMIMAVFTSVTVMEGSGLSILGVSLSSGNTASGTFVNRNHFANYLVLALSAGVGLLLSMQTGQRASDWRQRLRRWVATLLGPKARLRVFLALMVIALVLTRSRMGNTSFFVALLIAGCIALALIRRRQRPLVILIASLVVIDILIIGTWFGVEQVVDRIQQSVTVTEQRVIIHDRVRVEANREALEILRQSPLTGTGAGSWYTVFPQWRKWDHGFLDHAHNDYLEVAVEYGLPAAVLLGLVVVLSALRAWRQLASRRDPLKLGAAFTTMMAVIAVALHATVEFNLQIPANAATFMVLLALPWLHDKEEPGR